MAIKSKKILQSEDTVLIKIPDDKFADDEQDVKNMTPSEALNSLGVVKCFAEIHGDKRMKK